MRGAGRSTGAEQDRPLLFDRLIPPSLRSNVDAVPRARVVIGIASAGLLGDVFFGIYSLLKFDVPTLCICGIGVAVQLGNIALLWRTRRVEPSATVLTVLWMGSVVTAGIAVDATITLRSGWPLFTVVLATYLLGSRAGLASALTFAVSLGVVARLQFLGLVPGHGSAVWSDGPGVIFASIVLLLLCALIGSLHQRAYRRVVAEVAEANVQIQRSEASLRTLLDSSPDVIVSLDRELRIVELNEAARLFLTRRMGRTMALDRDTLEDALRFFSPEYQDRLRCGITRSLTGEHVEMEDTIVLGEQSITSTVNMDPVRLPDRTVVGVTVFGRDTSERRQREARSMINDRMTTVGTLAAGMAHELNNPLACVVANLEFSISALTPNAQSNPEELAEASRALVDAREGADRMRVIIRDLKTFSRVDDATSGPIEVQPAIEAAVKMCLNELRHRAQLVRDYQVVPAVGGNTTRLEQVVLNLLINAIHATPEGDAQRHTITLRTRCQGEGKVAVEVSDTGQGIPPENLKRIFDPFFTTKPVGVGTGLGLSICHNLIKGMGGEIEVASIVGQGTTFRVVLPVSRAEPEAPDEPVEPLVTLKPATVLLVDDEASLGVALRRALGSYGVELTAETRGKEALDRLRRGERFDLMICDLMMPDMTGMDLFEDLKNVAPDQARRLAFLSGGAFSPLARSFIDKVKQPALSKPCSVRQLVDLIRYVQVTGTTLSAPESIEDRVLLPEVRTRIS